MKRLFFYAGMVMPLLLLSGCGEDLAPEKTTGSITFVITEENTPQTLSGVSVQLFYDEDYSVTPSDRTDNVGRCTFSNIPIGSYRLSLSKPGYESKNNLPLRINGGDNPNREISLKRVTTLLTVEPSVLDFGESESVIQKAFSLVNPNYQELDWAVLNPDVPWIVSVCDKDGKNSGTLSYNSEVALYLTIDRNLLADGDNESAVVILSDLGRAELKVKAVGADRRTVVTMINEVQNIGTDAALFSAEMVSSGSSECTERGFVFSTSRIQSMNDDGFETVSAPLDAETSFQVTASGLKKGVRYYVRAYGKNSSGTALSSNEVTFVTTSEYASVETSSESSLDVVNGKVQLNGNISCVGDPGYSEKGFCMNTSGEPVIDDTRYQVTGSSEGAFSYSCADLKPQTTYYYRAYAVQNGNLIYGTTMNFSTNMSATLVVTSSATGVTATTATLHGSVVKDGSPVYTEKGFCISDGHAEPTINSRTELVESSSSDFSYRLGGLSYGKEYSFRAYAIQNGTPVYGEVKSFTTSYTRAEVVTSDATSVEYHSMILNGQVAEVGEPVISERGFCYSTQNRVPLISDSKVKVTGTSGMFKTTVKNLKENTEYYIRAYVVQDGEVIYGNVKKATTALEPVVQTGPAVNVSVTNTGISWQATMQGAYYDGSPAVVDAGFVYGIYDNPTVGNGTVVKYGSLSEVETDIYKFTKDVTGLNSWQTYYFRAFVITSIGYVYGETQTFSTF